MQSPQPLRWRCRYTSLDEDIGAHAADEPPGIVLPEGHDMVDARQRRQHLDAVLEPVDRPLVTLEAAHPRIGVDTDNQDVAVVGFVLPA